MLYQLIKVFLIQLGRVSYIFSDKTGTLTKNEMIFKNIALENEVFGVENFEDLKNIISDECQLYDAPLLDIVKNNNSSSIEANSEENNNIININESNKENIIESSINIKPKKKRRDRSTDNGYQASSPDEIALVQFAASLKMVLSHRTDKTIKIKEPTDKFEEFEILANFPFSSETKRMGIILKNKKYGHIIYYLKGAENVMTKFVKKEYIGYIKENAENLATKGLRTLVLTQKIIPQKDFDKWEQEYEEACASMIDRKKNMDKVVSKLENNMEYLCVTGVEDLLQDDVASTIDILRNAGMKLWMLTGDKVETATCISISAGFKNKQQKALILYTLSS